MNTSARATAYASLASVFHPPSASDGPDTLTSELLEALEGLDKGSAVAWQAAWSSLLDRSSADQLSVTYNRLFVGPMPPLAHPYESVYRSTNGQLMGQTTIQVIEAYSKAGVALDEAYHDLPDHVAVELEFMAYLVQKEAAARAADDEPLATTHLHQQQAFLREHLTRWIPHFCHRVVEADRGGFYGHAALTLATFILRDLEMIAAACRKIATPGMQSAKQLAHRQVGVWTLAFRAERPFPCTLCGICTEVCRPDALSLDETEWKIRLIFNQSQCNGCNYCVKFCPERILNVEKLDSDTGELSKTDSYFELASSDIAPCRNCGNPLISEAMLARVLDRFRRRKGDPNEEASMHLCHICKISNATQA